MTDRRGIRTYTGLELILEKNTMSQWKSIIFTTLFCLLLCTTELYALDSNKLNPEKQMENLSIDGIVKSLFGVVDDLGKWLKKYAPSDASYAGKDMGAVPYFSELPQIMDTHPEGLLCPNTTHNGYDINHFLALEPTFMALPHEENPRNITRKDGQRGFYWKEEFWQNYEYLFSFASRGKLHYAIYMRNGTDISQVALDEGRLLAKLSLEK